MKVILAATAIIVLSLSIVQAQEIRTGGNIAIGYTSSGINEASGVNSHSPLFYQGIEFYLQSLTWDLYVGALNSLSIEKSKEKKDYSNQVCYNAGLTKRLEKWKIDTGYSYYDLYKIEDRRNNLHAIYFSLEFPEIYRIIPYAYFERDIAGYKEVGGRDSMNLFRIGLCYSFEIFWQPIYPEISIAGHSGGFGYESESISSARARISTIFQFSNLLITPQISYQKRLGYHPDKGGIIEDEYFVWGGITVSFSF